MKKQAFLTHYLLYTPAQDHRSQLNYAIRTSDHLTSEKFTVLEAVDGQSLMYLHNGKSQRYYNQGNIIFRELSFSLLECQMDFKEWPKERTSYFPFEVYKHVCTAQKGHRTMGLEAGVFCNPHHKQIISS